MNEDSGMRDIFDISLAAAFQEVPVPEGLADRILDRLAADLADARDQRDSPLFADTITATVPSKRTFSRRWLLVGGGLLAAAAGLLIAVWLGAHKEEPFSEQFVLDEAIRAFEPESDGPSSLLAEKPAPEKYPLSQLVANVRGTRWRQLEDFLGRRVVVYDLPGPAGTHASLYVVAKEVDGLKTSPSLYPSFTTAGCCASAWQEDGLLYVLVVQGNPSTYRGFLNLPRSPLA
jgi:hypothetical protein